MHTALAVPADAEALQSRLIQEGYAGVTACYHPSGGFYSVQQSAAALTQDDPAAAAQPPSPYIPISAHTQQLTPLRLLQIMDALHGSGHNTAFIHPTPTQHTTSQQMSGPTPAQHASAQHTAADMQGAHQPMPAHGNGPTLPHSTPSTHAGSSSSGPTMFNLALVDRRDVVVLPAYDGLQPPAEGQQRQ